MVFSKFSEHPQKERWYDFVSDVYPPLASTIFHIKRWDLGWIEPTRKISYFCKNFWRRRLHSRHVRLFWFCFSKKWHFWKNYQFLWNCEVARTSNILSTNIDKLCPQTLWRARHLERASMQKNWPSPPRRKNPFFWKFKYWYFWRRAKIFKNWNLWYFDHRFCDFQKFWLVCFQKYIK